MTTSLTDVGGARCRRSAPQTSPLPHHGVCGAHHDTSRAHRGARISWRNVVRRGVWLVLVASGGVPFTPRRGLDFDPVRRAGAGTVDAVEAFGDHTFDVQLVAGDQQVERVTGE